MDNETLIRLNKRKQELRISSLSDGEVEDELTTLMEREQELKGQLHKLSIPVNHIRDIRAENALRRERGKLLEIELEELNGVYPLMCYPWMDGFKAKVLKKPNHAYQLNVRVYEMDQRTIRNGNAIVIVNPEEKEGFCLNDWIYVEPSPNPGEEAKYRLLGEYNYKGIRIKR